MIDLVPAVDRALRILSAFENGQAEYGVSELSRALGLNKSTVHNILNTLCHHNVLEQNPNSHKYRLGARLIELGYLARQGIDLREVARPVLIELMETTGETAFLSVFENRGITIIDRAESLDEMKITASIGQRVPFCAGCLGRIFLAWLSDAEVDHLLSAPGLRRFTDTSITSPSAFKERLALVRQRGYDIDEIEEYLEGVWAVSAPIRDTDGVVAALTVVGFTSRMSPAHKEATIDATLHSARRLSRRLGAQTAK